MEVTTYQMEVLSQRYTVLDLFGTKLERFSIWHDLACGIRIEHVTKENAIISNLRALHSRIEKTDMTWAILTFSFLWWPNSHVVGTDSIRGRSCFVIDVSPPLTIKTSMPNTCQESIEDISIATTRLWIDKELFMLIQVLEKNTNEDPVRKLYVDSMKKIDGKWIIKDLVIQEYPLRKRTQFHIREVFMEEYYDKALEKSAQ